MRHRRSTVKLGRTSSHRRAMLRNMVTSLLREERVATTLPKARECRRVAERVITFAKRGDLHARRMAGRVVQDNAVLKKLFDDIGPRFADRKGGYTRILKTGFRAGDNAEMSLLELLPDEKALARAAEAAAAEAEAKPKGKPKKKEPKPKGEKLRERPVREKAAKTPSRGAGGARKAPRKASKRGD